MFTDAGAGAGTATRGGDPVAIKVSDEPREFLEGSEVENGLAAGGVEMSLGDAGLSCEEDKII